jgi:hypothetical protein
MNNRLGVEWLAANDPKYVKPAMKAAATKRLTFSSEALEAMYGSATRKVNGRYVQVNPLAFVGNEESSAVEPTYEATQEQEVLTTQLAPSAHKAGKNSKASRNQRRRLARRAK